MDTLTDKSIFITGGAGSFGRAFVSEVLANHDPRRIIVYSRDEWKHAEMRAAIPDPRLDFYIGDIRDLDRLKMAMAGGVDIVIHAAALKRVDAVERDPFEAVKTNVVGTMNVLQASIQMGVKKVIVISSDKAVAPLNFYGCTKLMAERLAVNSNLYTATKATRISCVRYGNVAGSRGSVIPIFRAQAAAGQSLTLTHWDMTRFWITVKEAVAFVLKAIGQMNGAEVFVPKLPSFFVKDLFAVIAPHLPVRTIGIRPGEKLHELLISKDESRYASRNTLISWTYILNPQYSAPISEEPFEFSSETAEKLGVSQLESLLMGVE